ncbi:MAG: nucleotide exchange factor GrpE [Bacteroidetes bacterium]|nr:nucleotide exchange factor GrpE [Bacteroidota bacterium]
MNQHTKRHNKDHFSEEKSENQNQPDENTASEMPIPEENEETVFTEAEKWKKELEEQKAKYLLLYAEFDNYKRRTAKERLELEQTAGKRVIIPLLDLLDDCDRAEKLLMEGEKNGDQHLEGVFLIFNKFRSILQAQGLKPMDSLHEEFDVEKHEAISQIPAPTKELVGKVVDVVQKGYLLNDKIIRFAKVVIGI